MLRRISDYYCGYNWLASSKSPVKAKSSNCLFLCIRLIVNAVLKGDVINETKIFLGKQMWIEPSICSLVFSLNVIPNSVLLYCCLQLYRTLSTLLQGCHRDAYKYLKTNVNPNRKWWNGQGPSINYIPGRKDENKFVTRIQLKLLKVVKRCKEKPTKKEKNGKSEMIIKKKSFRNI